MRSSTDVPVTYDAPDEAYPAPAIYGEPIATRQAEMRDVMRMARIKSAIVLLLLTALCLSMAFNVFMVREQKVYVFAVAKDELGRNRRHYIDDTWTVQKGDVEEDLKWWAYHMRARGTDPVMNNTLKRAALARVADGAAAAFPVAYAEGDMPNGWTRDVDLESFSFSEMPQSDPQVVNWAMEWREQDYRNGRPAKEGPRKMFATVTLKFTPATQEYRDRGNEDGTWITWFDISVSPSSGQKVTLSVTERG